MPHGWRLLWLSGGWSLDLRLVASFAGRLGRRGSSVVARANALLTELLSCALDILDFIPNIWQPSFAGWRFHEGDYPVLDSNSKSFYRWLRQAGAILLCGAVAVAMDSAVIAGDAIPAVQSTQNSAVIAMAEFSNASRMKAVMVVDGPPYIDEARIIQRDLARANTSSCHLGQ
jgi:hypothetical protein